MAPSRLRVGLFFVALFVIAIFYSPQTALAGGGVGSGGSGGGGTGGSWGWTIYGHGWRTYSANGGGPSRGFHTGSWSSVKNTCKAANANQVVVYILGTGSGSPGGGDGGYMGYDYQGWGGTWGGGGSNVSTGTAHAWFNSLGSYGVSTAGYSWGSNVGWFCWDFSNKWEIVPSVNRTVNHNNRGWAVAGNTIRWNHRANNQGPDKTDKQVRITQQGDKLGGGSNPSYKSSGWNNGWGNRWNRTETYVVKNNDAGDKYCQRLVVKPQAWNDNSNRKSSNECVNILYRWSLNPNTSLAPGGVAVGDTRTWTHTVRNQGPNETDKVVNPDIRGDYTGADPSNIPKFWNAGNTKTYTRSHTIVPSDGGETICQRIRVNPGAWDRPGTPGNDDARQSANRCFYVPFDYELIPEIETQPEGSVEVGQEIQIDPWVENDGPTQSDDTRWEVHRFVFPSGVNYIDPAKGESNDDACSYSNYSGYEPGSCVLVEGSTDVFGVSPPQTPITIDNYTVPLSYDVGTKICFSLSIKPWKNRPGESDGSNWRHSDLACVIVSKKPKFHVEGGDLRARGTINTSLSENIHSTSSPSSPVRTYGSWVEYGTFSGGMNKLTSSGSGLRDGHSSPNPGDWSDLTFANTPSYGSFIVPALVTSASYFDELSDKGTVGSTLSAGGKNVRHVGNFTINGGNIDVGDSYIIVSSGTVTIKGDITYSSSPIPSVDKIPQVVIVARNINIEADVSKVDAWLLAEQAINTCSDEGNITPFELTSLICEDQLVVNGPVAAQDIRLLRTYGAANTNPERAAEIFKFSPDAYLWFNDYFKTTGRASTTYVTELPPRF